MKIKFMAFIVSILLFTSANARISFSKSATTNPLHSINVTDAGGLLTNGTLDVISFTSNGGTAWAICKLRGTVGGIEIDEDCICPITIGDCVDIPPRFDMSNSEEVNPFHCCIEIRFGPCTIRRATGLNLDLNPQNVQCTANDFLEDLLCAIHNTPRIVGVGPLVALLNQLL